jgi:hypothetical protein
MSYRWQGRSAAPATAPAAPGAARADAAWAERARARAKALALRAPHPELAAVMSLAAVLNLWALSRNGWANDYYAAAVKSMSSSWHDFLFASLDKGGVMTVDKPPLALWVQALSGARVRLSLAVDPRAAGADGRGERGARVRPGAPSLRPCGRLRGGPRAGADADRGGDLAPQQPGLAAGPVQRGGAVVHGARVRCGARTREHAHPEGHRLDGRGREHTLAGGGGRVRWPGLRDEDARGAGRRARDRGGVAMDRAGWWVARGRCSWN